MTASQEERPACKHDQAPSIVGLAVQIPSPCRCGSRVATIVADHALQCAECAGRRNRLSERTVRFLTEVVRCFGEPDRPIILRRPPR
jgi:hypothetical protein